MCTGSGADTCPPSGQCWTWASLLHALLGYCFAFWVNWTIRSSAIVARRIISVTCNLLVEMPPWVNLPCNSYQAHFQKSIHFQKYPSSLLEWMSYFLPLFCISLSRCEFSTACSWLGYPAMRLQSARQPRGPKSVQAFWFKELQESAAKIHQTWRNGSR